MRILHVAPFFHPHIGGVERHVLEAANGLAKRGHAVSVFTVAHEKGLPEREILGDLSLLRAPFAEGYFGRLASASRFVLGNRKVFQNFDIVHMHDFPAFAWSVFIPGKRTITFHGFERDPPRPYNRILRKLAEISVGSNFCVGKYLRRIYGTRCPDSRVIVGGVDWKKFSARGKRSDKRVVFLGRLENDNHPLECVRALSGKGIGIDFYGEGSLREEIRKLAEAERVPAKFFGATSSPEKVLPKYRVALVSKQLSILESLASGCKVVSFHSSALQKELLEGMGLPENAVALFHASDLGRAGQEISAGVASFGGEGFRKSLAKRFGWERVSGMYEREYFRLSARP